MLASVLISRRKSCDGEAALAELLGQRVRRRRHRHPALDQFRQQPRDQRGVARVVELELVDAHHDVVGQQVDALDEAEHPGQLGQLAERGERRSARRTPRNRSTTTPAGASCRRRTRRRGRCPTPGSASRLPNSFFLPARRATACSQNCRHDCTAAACDGSAGIRLVGVEADVGKRRRWNQLGDQPLRRDAGVPIDQMRDTAGPVHARTIAACCNSAYA